MSANGGEYTLEDTQQSCAIEELYHDFNEADISEKIQQNAQSKKAYEKLTEDILGEFRNQLGLAA